MKISKSLLKNIAVGLLVAGSITSCEVDDEPIEFNSDHLKTATESETEAKGETDPGTTTTILETIEETIEVEDGTDPPPPEPEPDWDWENCPACGMG